METYDHCMGVTLTQYDTYHWFCAGSQDSRFKFVYYADRIHYVIIITFINFPSLTDISVSLGKHYCYNVMQIRERYTSISPHVQITLEVVIDRCLGKSTELHV